MRSRLAAGAGAGAAAAAPAAAFICAEEETRGEKEAEDPWEVRPGGMLVQRREGSGPLGAPVPAVRVKVKHGAAWHEIYISSQATFGELKKELAGRTGLHPGDQKLIYKDKERDSAAFLDTAGVKDRSKLEVVEDSVARAKRLLEERRAEKMARAASSISAVGHRVDKLASKVSALETIVNKGGRVVEEDVNNVIEQLMNELVKLDGIVADGDVKLQKRQQVKRVQKYVETMDAIKVKNAKPRANGLNNAEQQQQQQQQQQKLQQKKQLQQPQTQSEQPNHQQLPPAQLQTQTPAAANWDFFDSLFTPSVPTPTSATPAIAASTAASAPATGFNWELF